LPEGSRKLLVADDSPAVLKVLSLTFSDEGMEVVTALDGQQALRLLEEQDAPDLIMADATMPAPDGYSLCERVKRDARLRHVPFVLTVGTFEPFNEAEARRVGADTVLTKPFQSIRDLVSKVGSLLGGEGKHEEGEQAQGAAPPDAERGATRPGDSLGLGHEPAPRPARAEAEEARRPSPEAPPAFESFDMDDELIEATPAESFGGAHQPPPPAAPAPAHGPQAASDSPGDSPDDYRPDRYSPDQFSPDFDDDEPTGSPDAGPRHAEAAPFDSAVDASPFGSVVLEPVAAGATSMNRQPSFEAQAAGTAAADETLLDLGDIEPPASASTLEADDFILDLGDDFAAPPAARASEPAFEPSATAAPPDAAGAFAEAAHGEPADAAFDFDTLDFNAPTPEPEARRGEETHATEVVMQDEPQTAGEDFGRQESAGSAPRGFVEPEVVPADEPVPATFESEFTDGSVEGDVPKPPAFVAHAAAPHEGFVSAAQPVASAPAEPSTAGFSVGEARVGIEEPLRPGQLSPEAIDAIARRVVELMSDKVVREIAWEVVPELAELLIKQRLEGKK